jgi:hypothetical protein
MDDTTFSKASTPEESCGQIFQYSPTVATLAPLYILIPILASRRHDNNTTASRVTYLHDRPYYC